MLIKSLEALHFRKYNKLVVDDIPESGIITVSGPNEAGKTSIGEAICFALFGRTFFQDDQSLHKVIRWGADDSEVTLTFKAGDGKLYSLWRSVDKENKTKVKFTDLESDSVLEDIETVGQALEKLLGFNFNAFSNSFYLAQRELTSPDPQSHSIKQMAGISAYANITEDLESSNQQHKVNIEELKPQVVSNQENLDEINLDETWLPELIDAEETLDTEHKSRSKLLDQLRDKEDFYSTNHTQFHNSKKSLSKFSFLGKFTFCVSVFFGFIYLINHFYPTQLIEFLDSNFTDSIKQSLMTFTSGGLIYATIIPVVIALFSWISCKKSKSSMLDLNAQAKDFTQILATGQEYVSTLTETNLPERVVQLLHERTDENTLQELPPEEQFDTLTKLSKNSQDYQSNPEEMSTAVSDLMSAIKTQKSEIKGFSDDILGDITEEKTRTEKAGALRSTIQKLNKDIDDANYAIETQTLALEIMQRAAANSIEKFNQNISDIAQKTLPNFTENRYSRLKIAEDFTVKIFSDDKNDYMDFDEISSGTQRQVMLSLRIAMSEQLSANSGNEEQFIFLDEPFAFFDQSRTSSTLENLPAISDVIKQIWISAQEFPENISVAKQINCPAKKPELIA